MRRFGFVQAKVLECEIESRINSRKYYEGLEARTGKVLIVEGFVGSNDDSHGLVHVEKNTETDTDCSMVKSGAGGPRAHSLGMLTNLTVLRLPMGTEEIVP